MASKPVISTKKHEGRGWKFWHPIPCYPQSNFNHPPNLNQIKPRNFNGGLRRFLLSASTSTVEQAGIQTWPRKELVVFRPVLVTFIRLIYALQAHDLILAGLASLLIIAACKKLFRIPCVFLFWVKKIKSISK